jgi:hypothetical protein
MKHRKNNSMDTYDVYGPRPSFHEAEGNVIEVKVADNDVRQGHEYAYDGGAKAYRDELAQGFLAARDNGPERRAAGLRDPGRSNPSQWTRVDPAALLERPRQVYETTTGADERTSAFARANPSPTWDAVDGAMLHAFAYGTAPTDATGSSERVGNTIQAKLADAGRRPNPAEITEGRRRL